jgi:crotonobetainyl-CoA:carnitine CoA-transferase CaiB-like acyl-CoA transferase
MYAIGWDLGVQLTLGAVQQTYERHESPTPLINSYRTADDRWFFLLGLEGDRHYPGLTAAIGRADLLTDERFTTGRLRIRNRRALIAELDAVFAARPLAEWAAVFDRHDVWWSLVQTAAEVVDDPQAQRALIDLADTGFRTVGPPARFSDAPLTRTGPVPALGEHTVDVLRDIGLTDAEIEALEVHTSEA